MLPCENTLAGRVPDIHHLLPDSGLFVVGEHFQRIEHCLLGPRGATLAGVRRVHSHAVALGQVRDVIRRLGATAVIEGDTAGAAELVAGWANVEDAAVASSLAAEIYGLSVLAANVEDAAHNTTRFYVMARQAEIPAARRRRPDDHVRLPGAQRAGRAVQGARRLRDQRREHDQARELHGRRRVHPPRSSCATSTADPSTRTWRWRWRSCGSSRPRCGCSACIPPRASDDRDAGRALTARRASPPHGFNRARSPA